MDDILRLVELPDRLETAMRSGSFTDPRVVAQCSEGIARLREQSLSQLPPALLAMEVVQHRSSQLSTLQNVFADRFVDFFIDFLGNLAEGGTSTPDAERQRTLMPSVTLELN